MVSGLVAQEFTDPEGLRKKNIAIRLDIYEKLLDMKHGKDTFSDVIERLLDARSVPKLRK